MTAKTLNLKSLTEEQQAAFIEGWETPAASWATKRPTPGAAPGTGPTKSKSKAKRLKSGAPTGGVRTRRR